LATGARGQEEVFLADLETALPRVAPAISIGDRGYARAALLRHTNRQQRLYILCGRAGARVEYQGRSCKLGELKNPPGQAVRFCGVRYQARERVPIDVVAYHDPQFQEPWWSLVPPDRQDLQPGRTPVRYGLPVPFDPGGIAACSRWLSGFCDTTGIFSRSDAP